MVGYRHKGRLTADEERDLGLRIRAGDDEAWRELVDRNAALVLFLVGRMSWPPGMAHDDVKQLGMLGLMKAAREYDPDKFPGARFASYARYAIRNSVVAAGSREMLPLLDVDPPVDPSPSPDIAAMTAEDVACLRRELGRLDARERRVIEGRHLSEGTPETLETLGIEMGVTKQYVWKIEQTAMAKLRARLAAKVIGRDAEGRLNRGR